MDSFDQSLKFLLQAWLNEAIVLLDAESARRFADKIPHASLS